MKSPVNFKLIAITNSSLNSNLVKKVTEACKAGVKAVQLREKNISGRNLLDLSKKLRIITKKYHTKLIINDRYDIAVLSDADGLHSPEHGISPGQVNRSEGFVIGRSVHSLKSAVETETEGFDYLIFGPIYQTPSKVKFGKPQGIGRLQEICGTVKIPVFAVGGINPERAKKCIEAGAHGVAVVREIMLSKNIRKTVSKFKNVLGTL